MSIYDRPFDPNQSPRPGCVCGRHRSPAEHDHEVSRTMMCEAATPFAKEPYKGVVAAAVLRKMF